MSNIVLNNGDGVTVLDSTNTKAVPIDGEGRGIVNTYEDIANIRNPYLYMRVIVRNDSQDGTHPKGEYIITSLTNIGKVDVTGIKSFKEYVAESDPNVPAHVKAITQQNITDWNGKQDAITPTNTLSPNNIKDTSMNGKIAAYNNSGVLGSSAIDTTNVAVKSEMSIVDGTGADAGTATIQLKSGTSKKVLTQHQSLEGKVDKVPGKGLSANDYDNTEKGKVANAIQMPSGATSDKVLGYENDAVAWITKPSNGKSAYQIWYEENEYDDPTTYNKDYFLASLKAQFGSFVPAAYGTDGKPSDGTSDIPASADTTNNIYLVDNLASNPTAKVMWITIIDNTDPQSPLYSWTSIGDVQVNLNFASNQRLSDVNIKDANDNVITNSADVLSAEAGAAMNNTLTTVDKRVGVIEPTVTTVDAPFVYGKTYYPNNQHPTYVVIGEEVQIVTEPTTTVGSFNYKMVDVKPGDILNVEISQRRVAASPDYYIVLLNSSNVVVGVDGEWPESTTAVTNEYIVTIPSGVAKVMVQCYGDATKVCNIVKTTVYSLKERTDDLAEEMNYTEVGNLPFYAQSNKIKVSGQDITISEAPNFKHFILFDIMPDDVLHIKTVQHSTPATCPNYVIIVGSDNKVVEAVPQVTVTTGDIHEYTIKAPENIAYVVVNYYYSQTNQNNDLIGVVRERNGLKEAVAGLEKKEELTFNVVNHFVDAYLKASRQYTTKDYSYSIVTNYQDNPKVRHDQPNGVKISWDVPNLANGTLCDVVISDNQNYTTSNKGFVKTLTGLNVSDGECSVYNLVPKKRYFYKVIVTLKEGFVYLLVEGTFELVGAERMVKVDSVPNVRDIGGWKTQDGRMVRYGIMYRGNALDSHGGDVTQDEVAMLTTDLGITAELDMRGESSYTTSALGEDVDFFQQDIEPNPAEGNLTNSAKCVKILQQVKDWLNNGDVVYYHCAGGCDRTGLLTFIILALCGVHENDICRDYELSSFSIYGANYQTRQRNGDAVSQIKYWVTYFKTMVGDTLKEQVSSYLTRYDGTSSGYPDTMTQADINELVELLVD